MSITFSLIIRIRSFSLIIELQISSTFSSLIYSTKVILLLLYFNFIPECGYSYRIKCPNITDPIIL